MGGIRDGRNAKFDPSICKHHDQFRTAPQIEMREQMTDVFPYGDVLEPHFQRDDLGWKPAYQPRQGFELSRSQSQFRCSADFRVASRMGVPRCIRGGFVCAQGTPERRDA
uniref:Uncharacterized protein n=1 Tax=Paraburkholderia sprentiae WSM5005 TaxID=754502 RepID=A0A1I9YUQ8_9BURK